MASPSAKAIDVAIVGGGPAGLAAACAIRRRCPDLRLQVFERGPRVPKKGAGLAMYPNGVAALTAISKELAAKVWDKACRTPVVVQTVDSTDKVLQESTLDWGPKKPERQAMVYMAPWYELTQTLFEDLPEGTVQFGHSLSDLVLPKASSADTTDAKVPLTFSNGSSYEARLVLGCDGLLSPVRRAWMQGSEGPSFQNSIALRGRIATHALKGLPAWSGNVGSRWYVHGAGHYAMVYTVDEATSVFVMNVPFSTVQEKGVSYAPYGAQKLSAHEADTEYMAGGIREEALKVVDCFAPSLRQVVEACDPASCTMNGTYYLPWESMPDGHLGSGPITLLGDAAHPMPLAGQGANLALEDAAVLAYYLQQHGPTEAALRAYEADRVPRCRSVAKYVADAVNFQKQVQSAQQVVDKQKAMNNKGGSLEYSPEVHAFQHPCMQG